MLDHDVKTRTSYILNQCPVPRYFTFLLLFGLKDMSTYVLVSTSRSNWETVKFQGFRQLIHSEETISISFSISLSQYHVDYMQIKKLSQAILIKVFLYPRVDCIR